MLGGIKSFLRKQTDDWFFQIFKNTTLEMGRELIYFSFPVYLFLFLYLKDCPQRCPKYKVQSHKTKVMMPLLSLFFYKEKH
ncbi:hypothetical protein BCR42DRAFT_421430, partial [Absidia repens]